MQRWLVVMQVALCVVLLAGAGLLLRTLVGLSSVDTGVRHERVLTMDIPIQGDFIRQVGKTAENLLTYERIRDRVAALPGVSVAALASTAPLSTSKNDMAIYAQGHSTDQRQPPATALKSVDPRYFGAVGVSVLRGRGFDAADIASAPAVAILSRGLAAQLFGADDPVGQGIQLADMLSATGPSNKWITVVGVVSDTREKGLDAAPTPMVYRPFAQTFLSGANLTIRTRPEPSSLQQTVGRAIREIYPQQVVEHVVTIDQLRDEGLAPRRMTAIFVASFGVLAFLIAIVGVAGVLAFSVSSRTAEIGIRMSLGADAGSVRRMVMVSGGALLLGGVVIGGLIAGFATRLLRSVLFDITPHDPLTFGAVAILVVAAGLAACWIPADRAARVDPAIALRTD